jgi:phosphatidylglycerophosphate synthase
MRRFGGLPEKPSMTAGILDSFMLAPPHAAMLHPSASTHRTSPHPARRALVLSGAAITALAALGAHLLLPEARPFGSGLALAVMAVTLALCLRALAGAHPHPQLGPANQVTLLRAGIMALTAAALCLPGGLADRPQLAWGLVALVAAGLALDGVDGWLARRTRLASAFGARFDMEVDAALAAILCLLAILSGKAGLWLIPLGFLRYAWVLAGHRLPWLTRPLPDRLSRKAICVVQIAVLTALLAPPILAPLSTLLAATALIALLWSFGQDALWLWRTR